MTRAPAILAVLLAAALSARALSPWELYADSRTNPAAAGIDPFCLWDSTDVQQGTVTQWASRVGSYKMTNWSGMTYAPTNAGDGIVFFKDAAPKGMALSPPIVVPTNSAFAFAFRRQASSQRFVGFGNLASSSVQVPFVFTDSSLYGSPGFAIQTRLSSGGFPTGTHVLVMARDSTSVWARLDGAAFGSNSPASTPSTVLNQFGFLASSVGNGSTNAFYRVACYSNSTRFTDADLDAIYEELK